MGTGKNVYVQPPTQRDEVHLLKYGDLLKGLPIGYYRSAPTGQILEASPGMVEMLGYPSQESLLEVSAEDLYVDPQDRHRWQAVIEGEKVVVDFETRFRRHDGTSIWVQDHARAVLDELGQAQYYEGVLIDTSARKRGEETLRQREESFRVLFANNPLPMWVYDASTLAFLEVNDAAVERYGYFRDEFLRMRISEIRPQEDVPRLLEDVAKGRTILQHSGEWRHRLKDGQVIDVQITSHKLEYTGRDAVLVVAQDITERKLAEEALRVSEARFRELFENANDVLFTLDLEGNFTSINKVGEQLSGYSREEATRMKIDDVVAPEYLVLARQMMASKVRGGGPTRYELEMVTKDGRQVPLEISTQLVYQKRQLIGIQGIARDVSDRRRAEESIERHVQRVTALHTIDLAIASTLDLRVSLNVLLDQVTSQLRVDAADVLVLNPHTQMLEYAAGRGFRRTVRDAPLRLGEGIAGRVALERRIFQMPTLAESGKEFKRAQLISDEKFVSYHAAPLIAKGQVKGVLEVFHRTPLSPDQDWVDFLKALAGQAAIALDSAMLFNDLQRANLDLTVAYDATLEGWVHALDMRDRETEGHTQRVTELTVRLAPALGVSESELVHVRRGALLHDIGKMAIPDAILHKADTLTDDEQEIIRRHPVYAYELLSPIPYLRPALDIPYCHHEKWDGTGYPRGLKGEQIPMPARIFALVDVWDALRSDRPYRPAWTKDRVREHIREQIGSHFEPKLAEAFLEWIYNR